jgi:hypothetical protein
VTGNPYNSAVNIVMDWRFLHNGFSNARPFLVNG